MKVVKNLDALFAALKDYGFNAWDIKQYLDDNKKHIVFPLIPEEVEIEAKFLRKRLQKQMGESMKLDEAQEILKQNGFICEGDMSLADKIENAKNFNSWDNKDEETRIELLKELLDDGYDFRDDNPYSDQDIFADFYSIDDLADVYDEVVDKLEDAYERGDDFGGDWDMWLLDHTTFILKDILNGKTAEQIIKKFKKYF